MRLLSLFAIGSLSLGLTAFAARGQDPIHPHHHLHHALWELRDAQKELKETKYDFGAHKEKAQAAIHDAIKQIDLVLKNAGDNIKGAPTRGDLKEEYRKYKHHPHLHHAQQELKHAHRQLKESKHDFGGHRDAAMRDIRFAREQIDILLKSHK